MLVETITLTLVATGAIGLGKLMEDCRAFMLGEILFKTTAKDV